MTGARPTASGPLTGYGVLEIGDLRTALGARMLADPGAEVIRVEPLGGLPDRQRAPFSGGGRYPTTRDSNADDRGRAARLAGTKVIGY